MKKNREQPGWKDTFHMTKIERRGTLALSLMLCLSTLWPLFRPNPDPPPPLKTESYPQPFFRSDTLPPDPVRFAFNPNTLPLDSLVLLGIPERTARTLINYRKAGGRFRQADDLTKLYGWREEDHKRLKSWMSFPKAQTHRTAGAVKPLASTVPIKERAATVIDINAADEEGWQQLSGIGPYYARRIVRFREALGGFYSVEQVADTYRLPDSVFQSIKPSLRLHQPPFQLDINGATPELLAQHPYLSLRQARALVAYRNEHGPFTDQASVRGVLALDDATMRRLDPYLNVTKSAAPPDSALVDKKTGIVDTIFDFEN